MENLSLERYSAERIAELREFFKDYLSSYPDAKLNPAEFYTFHPVMEAGENVFCVVGADRQIHGFAPVFPVVTTDENGLTGPHVVWTTILARPKGAAADMIRGLLLEAVMKKAKRMQASYHLPRSRLAADMMVSQKGDVDYLLRNGFAPFGRVYVMMRDTNDPIPDIALPEGISFNRSRLASAAERASYLDLYNSCFPEMAKTEGDLDLFLRSPLWEKGSAIQARSVADEPVGSVLVYWDEAKAAGVIDDVMVRPDWRGRNIAKALVGEGLRYLRTLDIRHSFLEVRANNTPAVTAYLAMGYRVVNEETMLGLWLE